MSDSTNTQKIVFGALAAAAGVVLLGYLFRSSTKRSRSLSNANKSTEKPSSDNKANETISKDEAANYAKGL